MTKKMLDKQNQNKLIKSEDTLDLKSNHQLRTNISHVSSLKLNNSPQDINCLVSIILPVYNAEKYLNKCITSILHQTYSDFELIIINDGSTDTSFEILEHFKTFDNRIKLFSQNNRGVSAARNVGMNYASGKYIYFADADDYLSDDCLEKLVLAFDDESVCMSCSAYYAENEKYRVVREISTTDHQYDYVKFLGFVAATNDVGGYLWNKMFLKEIILKNSIIFDQTISICEDQLFCCQYLNSAKGSVVYIADPLYHYVENTESALHKNNNDLIFREFPAIKRINEISDSYLESMFYAAAHRRYTSDLLNISISRSIENNIDYIKPNEIEIKNSFSLLSRKNKLKFRLYQVIPFFLYRLTISFFKSLNGRRQSNARG